MATSHDSGIDQTMEFVAVTAATAGTLVVTATTLIACLPLTSAASGAVFTGKIMGRVNGVTKSTSTAFLAGAPLSIGTAGAAIAATVGAIINAYAYGAAGSSSSTMDVLLVPPVVN